MTAHGNKVRSNHRKKLKTASMGAGKKTPFKKKSSKSKKA